MQNKIASNFKKERWSTEEIETLKKMYPITEDKKEILKALPKRNWIAITLRASILNIKRYRKTSLSRVEVTPNTPEIDDAFANYICGFVDGEGCFYISVSRQPAGKAKFRVRPCFKLHQRAEEIELIKAIASIFNCGYLYYRAPYANNNPAIDYHVSNASDLVEKVIPFFEKYNLRGNKRSDFDIWKKVVYMVKNKEHLTQEGVKKIMELRASMNYGGMPNRTKIEELNIDDPCSRTEHR